MENSEWRIESMALIKNFRDLNVYQAARVEGQRIYLRSRSFPAEEKYSLTDQIRRSSRAVKAMVAEAWARRRYRAVFVNKIDEALGEATETQSWLDDCLDCGYISADEFKQMNAAWQSIGAMLNKMILRADDFCGTKQD
jgi:four helix bundle protein